MYIYNAEGCCPNAFYCPWDKFDYQVNVVMKQLLGETGMKSALTERDGTSWQIVLFADFTDAITAEQIKQKLSELYKKYGYENELDEDWATIEFEWPYAKDRLYICREVSERIISEYYLRFAVAFSLATDEGMIFAAENTEVSLSEDTTKSE